MSIQLISKEAGYRVVETIGSSRDVDEIERMFLVGKEKLESIPQEQPWLFSIKSKEELAVDNFVLSLSNGQVRTVGPELIFGTLFDRIGFNRIEEELFRHLTIARLVYPVSKLKTIDYLHRYRGIKMSVDRIYRFMDKLNHRYKGEVETIAYRC